MIDLSEVLKDEAWLEGEKRGTNVPLFDDIVFQRSLRIWENHYEKKQNSEKCNPKLDLEKMD